MRRAPSFRSGVRRHLGPLTWFALSAFLWGVALPVLETHEVADPDEAAFQLAMPDGGAPRIDKPDSASSAPEHCVFCHWQRAVSGAMVTDVARIASPCPIHSRCRLLAARLTASASSSNSSRGPPPHV